ncbi:MAG: lytic transglycosylase, partial [Pseudomonadota bacterium]|nr:lytic transglycosylase [Pseudomonadota bacterium]
MSRVIGAMILLLIVASCGGGSGSPPRNLDNACSIIKQRPEYLKAFRATERKWGVPMHVQMATIYQESRFRSDARTPHRFALGV